MIWHIVRFDFTGVDPAERRAIEDDLRGLAAIDEVGWLRVAREIGDAEVTGLITVFADEAALDTYRVHPLHTPVVARIRAAGASVIRLDIETDDDVTELP